ncbi:hypothetical protein GOZ78_08810 [Agrobacterium vitis]|uniref:Tail protein X n=1 Tax=Agrobacterium vitis TaxID=373 RepID=A0A1S2E4D4_AGRVI|nr:tail protein X [Agrobacterium vitis]MCF1454089.1 hypothetical protein [Agrobacterium vitis]MUO78141.1 hypothetical protein [Agrobacterium vitis]MUO94019.1 hypothetical protein [Agrobacterium vitis]MUP03527.1 hypothetical protein [Agrobacterium vitis]MUZ85074.1 hypothetical protein [Agrobacterium vitis]
MTELTGDYFEYTTVAGDRWDMLAYSYYGDQYKQTVLIEANRHLYLDTLTVPPAILPQGVKLKIPVIAETATNADVLPPWKTANPTYGAS